MNKKIVSSLIGILLSFSAGTTAKDWKNPTPKLPKLNVGDKMPDFSEYSSIGFWRSRMPKTSREISFVEYDRREIKNGLSPNHHYLGDRKPDYVEMNIICKEYMKNSFAVVDLEHGIIYLNPKMNSLIEEIIGIKDEIDEKYVPDCPK